MGSSRSWTRHPLASCVGYWESLLIPSWSFPFRIWVCNPPVESMLRMCRVACSKEVQPSVTVAYLHSMSVVFYESCTLSQLSVTISHLRLNRPCFESVLYQYLKSLYYFASCKGTHHCPSLIGLFLSTSTHYPRIRSRNPKQHPRPVCPNDMYLCHRQ